MPASNRLIDVDNLMHGQAENVKSVFLEFDRIHYITQ